MHWLYLLLAAIFEIGWMYSFKFLDGKVLKSIKIAEFFTNIDELKKLIPLVLYIGFGLLNVIFLSKAMAYIPTALAFSIWYGTALIGATLIDVFYFKEPSSWLQFLFLGLILVGVIGLKTMSK